MRDFLVNWNLQDLEKEHFLCHASSSTPVLFAGQVLEDQLHCDRNDIHTAEDV